MALDMVDHLIFDAFLKLNKSFFDECDPPNTLDDLSREKLFEGIVLLLWNCDPDSRSLLTSTVLPHNMAMRFRAAMNVVDTIKRIGVRDEINYQTLLYGKVKELRNVLVGIIEKLPNKTLVIEEESPTTLLIRKALARMNGKAVGSLTTKYCLRGGNWKPSWGICQQFPFVGCCGNIDEAFRHPVDWQRMTLCAVLEGDYSPGESASPATNMMRSTGDTKNTNEVVELSVPHKSKPPVPPKKHLMLYETKPSAKESGENKEDARTSALSEALSEVAREASQITVRLADRRAALEEQQEMKARKLEKLNYLKNEAAKIDTRLLKLIDSPKVLASIVEYVENISETERRAQELQSKWLAVKIEKEHEIQKARQLYNEKLTSGSYTCEISELGKRITELNKQIPLKEARLQELISNAEALEKAPVNRSIYTKRIFEMVESIKKQQDEIKKSHAENAQLQKEIVSISGKLDRSFTAVEECLYREALRDATMQKAYRILVKIHGAYTNVITAIERSRKAEKETNEINDLVFMMQQKGLDEMLGKLHADWIAVKEENERLMNILNHSE